MACTAHADIVLQHLQSVMLQFALDDRSATIQLGDTRVMTVITAELAEPFPDRCAILQP